MIFLSEIMKIGGVDYIQNEPLDIHSTMRVGGTARLSAFPKSVDALCELLDFLNKKEIKHFVAGNASNTIFPDGEYNGVVIFTKNLKNISVSDVDITAECGVNLIYLSEIAKENSLSGAEFLCGIPGTVGGAVYMNAGALGHSVSDIVLSSKLYLPSKNVFEADNKAHKYSFRDSVLRHNGAVVLSTTFRLGHADKQKIIDTMNEMRSKRSASQPLDKPSAGSVFLPVCDTPAWKYIDGSGLRGASCGGARVSDKHAGFIVNTGGATAADIKTLVTRIQNDVFEKYGVELKTEIIFVE